MAIDTIDDCAIEIEEQGPEYETHPERHKYFLVPRSHERKQGLTVCSIMRSEALLIMQRGFEMALKERLPPEREWRAGYFAVP
jgi:hypothetical protein